MRIDSHQHFWHYTADEFAWISEAMTSLKQDFLPPDLEPLLAQTGLDGTVAVEARQSLAETEWLLFLASSHDFIKGVVGWVDLQSPTIGTQLETYVQNHKLRGVRHVIHDEPDDEFILRPGFLTGLALLHEFNLTFDLLLFPKHLPVAIQAVKRLPDQKFVLDHIAKPLIRDHIFSPWREDIRELATSPNVYCKVSGMVTEADWKNWQPADFRPYLDVIFEYFGPERVMFGSDWPVCSVSGTYQQVLSLVQDYVKQFPISAQDKILGGTATAFYGLEST